MNREVERRLSIWAREAPSRFSDATIWWDGDPAAFQRSRGIDVSRLIAAFACATPLDPGLRLALGGCDELLIGRGVKRQWQCQAHEMLASFPARTMSRLHARLIRWHRHERWSLDDVSSKNGTYVNGKRVSHHELVDGDLVEMGAVFFVYRDDPGERLRPPDHRDLAADEEAAEGLRTLSIEMEARARDLIRAAPTADPVLIEGEPGTGKELAARAVHARSARSGPFVRVPCRRLRVGAIAGEMERADGGTLFLDRLEDLHWKPQVELRQLLDGPIQRDVRVIASTRRDRQTWLAGDERPDLYQRLACHHVVIPPLRDRREDIGSIAAALLRRIAPDRADLRVHRDAAFALMTHAYPLNVRELENALRDAVGLACEGEILLEHLPPAMRDCEMNPDPASVAAATYRPGHAC